MGKKGNWFSAIKRVFLPNSKDKLANESDKRSTKEKKKSRGKPRHGETTSFIPCFREPSSIEKILDEAEREHKLIFRPPTPPEQPTTPPSVPPRAASLRVASQRVASPRAASPRVASPRAASPRNAQRHKEIYYRPEPTLRNHHASATKIQAAYRGYANGFLPQIIAIYFFAAFVPYLLSFFWLKAFGKEELQSFEGSGEASRSDKRTECEAADDECNEIHAALGSVQSQIQSRRIQMLENQARRQAQNKNDKGGIVPWANGASHGTSMEHVVYYPSDQCTTPLEEKYQNFSQSNVKDLNLKLLIEIQILATRLSIGSNAKACPQLVNERVTSLLHILRKMMIADSCQKKAMAYSYSTSCGKPLQNLPVSSLGYPFQRISMVVELALKNFQLTRQGTFRDKTSPRPPSSSHKQSKSQWRISPFNLPLKDDDSLTSCPPFSVPNYMTPTASDLSSGTRAPYRRLAAKGFRKASVSSIHRRLECGFNRLDAAYG
uniref:DUF4005 domain-containing protein n=1 Tax=Salix viminalis TaxID=40686 RepID=A0A6N2LZN2_SALVM